MTAVANLLPTIVPKSDQLNSDDLIGRTLTIKVTKVSLCEAPDQPITIHFEGDDGKPFKPCKSMRRVMVAVWGPDGNAFVGRRMTLYRDDKVQFGGAAVGGIRISHMSDIDRDVTMALTASRASRKPYTVRPLPPERSEPPAGMKRASDIAPPDYIYEDAAEFASVAGGHLEQVKTTADLAALWGQWADELKRLRKVNPVAFQELTDDKDTRKRELEADQARDDDQAEREARG